jgi:hypothetical protein
MRNTVFYVMSVCMLLTVANCATLFGGSTQVVSINSNVSGATIELDGLAVGLTPFTGEVSKNKKVLQLKKEGYEPKTIVLSTGIATIFWLNILFPGVYGSSTDYSTGAMYNYSPANFQVDLEPVAKGKK